MLAEEPQWWLMVLEYGITHGRMVVALHQGDYPRGIRLELLAPHSFEGALRGGPYALELRECTLAGEPALELVDRNMEFRLVFEAVRFLRRIA